MRISDWSSDVCSSDLWTEMGLCIGVGRMQILAGNVNIGDTSLLSLGADAEYQIFEPGDPVSAYSAYEWWHTAAEVGASSTDRKSVGWGKRVSVSADLGGRGSMTKKKKKNKRQN